MKKSAVMIILACIMLALGSCTQNNTCYFHQKTLDLIVPSSQWQWDDNAQRFYAHFDRPEITAAIYNYGTWIFTREYNYGTKDAYQVALPESTYKTETLEDSSVVNYTQHIDYAIGIGWVEVTYTISDFYYPTDQDGKRINPEEMRFHLQLNY